MVNFQENYATEVLMEFDGLVDFWENSVTELLMEMGQYLVKFEARSEKQQELEHLAPSRET